MGVSYKITYETFVYLLYLYFFFVFRVVTLMFSNILFVKKISVTSIYNIVSMDEMTNKKILKKEKVLAKISCVPKYVISSDKCSIKILKIAKLSD